jgi:hypothetical protein
MTAGHNVAEGCDELIDEGAIITGEVGCMRPELGEFIQ